MATTNDEVALLQEEIVDLVKRATHEAQVAVLEGLRDILEKEIDGDIATTDPSKAAGRKPKRGGAKAAGPRRKPRTNGHLKDDELLGAVGAGLVCSIDGCGYVGKNAGGLGVHQARKHKGAGRYPCDAAGCEYRAHTDQALGAHKRTKHRLRASEEDRWTDIGEGGVCDVKEGGCDGGVSEYSCKYERTAGCKFVVRRCQAHRGDAGCKMGLGRHHKYHERAGHDAPAFD